MIFAPIFWHVGKPLECKREEKGDGKKEKVTEHPQDEHWLRGEGHLLLFPGSNVNDAVHRTAECGLGGYTLVDITIAVWLDSHSITISLLATL